MYFYWSNFWYLLKIYLFFAWLDLTGGIGNPLVDIEKHKDTVFESLSENHGALLVNRDGLWDSSVFVRIACSLVLLFISVASVLFGQVLGWWL